MLGTITVPCDGESSLDFDISDSQLVTFTFVKSETFTDDTKPQSSECIAKARWCHESPSS